MEVVNVINMLNDFQKLEKENPNKEELTEIEKAKIHEMMDGGTHEEMMVLTSIICIRAQYGDISEEIVKDFYEKTHKKLNDEEAIILENIDQIVEESHI